MRFGERAKGPRIPANQPGTFRSEDWLRFVELPSFTRKWEKLGYDDEDSRALESALLANPTGHPVMQGTGGLRKVRFAGKRSGQGKSGAARVCYAVYLDHSTVVLVAVFSKSEQANLSAHEKQLIAKVLREIQEDLKRGAL